MRIFTQMLSFLSLLATVIPAYLFWMGIMDLNTVKWIMFLATIVWFVATPVWMERKET